LQKLRFDTYLTPTAFQAELSELAQYCSRPAGILPPSNDRRHPSSFWWTCARQVEIPGPDPSHWSPTLRHEPMANCAIRADYLYLRAKTRESTNSNHNNQGLIRSCSFGV